MILKSIHVKNFRCILDEKLECDSLTALVGPNGAGKSCFLRALELFYSTSPKVDSLDFYAEETSEPIEITIAYASLEPEANEQFKSYIENGQLSVVRVLALRDGKLEQSFHGSRLANPQFASIRSSKAQEGRKLYEDLRNAGKCQDLPQWQNQAQALAALRDWEQSHADQCVRQRDEGQFFGFSEVAQGYLGRYTKLISIPAVRDASVDAEEGRGSPLKEIVDLVVRNALAAHKELLELKEETKKRYDEIVNPENLSELHILQDELTKTLQTYVPDSEVHLDWIKAAHFEIPMPRTDARLVEDGYKSSVSRTGHGLQRAFILTLLQHVAVVRPTSEKADGTRDDSTESGAPGSSEEEVQVPDLILAVEEPELYQHPNRQRHLASLFQRLASGTITGVARSTQVVYSTHSPLFVGLDRLNQVRVLRKLTKLRDKPRVTHVNQTTLDAIAEELWKAHGQQGEKFTGHTLFPRLRCIMTPLVNEGFFADVAVLVEGESDRAAILGTAMSQGHQLESLGASVIPCGGKTNLDRVMLVFRALGIEVYVVWDSDDGGSDPKIDVNRRLLRLLGQEQEDYPEAVTPGYACFRTELEDKLKSELGNELFEKLLTQLQVEFELPRRGDVVKNPVVMMGLLENAREQGRTSATLEGIVQRILALNPTAAAA